MLVQNNTIPMRRTNWNYVVLLIPIFWLIQSISYTGFGQSSNSKTSIGGSVQLGVEEQSYIEHAFHNSKLVDIEKNAGACFSYKLDFFQEFKWKKGLMVSYIFGYKWANQLSDYSEIYSSDFDFLEMGFSQIRSGYLCFSLGLSFRNSKSYNKRTYFIPHLSIGSNFLAFKDEKLTPYKNTFDYIQNPYSRFYSIVPEVSFDFLVFHIIRDSNYSMFFGPGLKNSPKYYHEQTGALAAPLAFSFKFGISKSK